MRMVSVDLHHPDTRCYPVSTEPRERYARAIGRNGRRLLGSTAVNRERSLVRAVAAHRPDRAVVVGIAAGKEDVASVGLLYLAYEYPYVAGAIALVLLALMIWLIILARRVLKRVFAPRRPPDAPPRGIAPNRT